MTRKKEELSDIQECKKKINILLDFYGCELMDGDEGTHVLIVDKDTEETDSINYYNK